MRLLSQNGEEHGTCNVIGPVGTQNTAFSIPPCIIISLVTKTVKYTRNSIQKYIVKYTRKFLFHTKNRGIELFVSNIWICECGI